MTEKVDEYDDEKMMKNCVVEAGKEIVCFDEDFINAGSIVKPTNQKKQTQKRRRAKKKNISPPWLGRATHDSPPPSDLGSTFLISSTSVEWRVLGYHFGGDVDPRSESTLTKFMASLFSFNI